MAQPKCSQEVLAPVDEDTSMWLAAWYGGRVGAIYMGGASAVLGLLLGAAAGAAVGSLFAPLTFGISAPACCFFGALVGLLLGGGLGCGGGLVLGASLGVLCFTAELPSNWTKPREGQLLQVAAPLVLSGCTGPCFSACGAFLGLLSGAFLGLIAGLLLAPFTFGLSVPICSFLGGILGAAVDAATGVGRLCQPFISAFNRWRFQLAMLIAPSLDLAKTAETPETILEECAKPRRARRRVKKVSRAA